jgi:phosphoglucosamine mutase
MFGTSGVRGPVGSEITTDLAVALGRAVAEWGAQTVVVGRDPRPTGAYLEDAVAAGLRENGADVIDIGETATPTLARSVGWLDADAGVMVTASHNPPTDNGFKLWTPSGRAFSAEQRAEIAEIVAEGDTEFPGWNETGDRRTRSDVEDRHVEELVESVEDVGDVEDVGTTADDDSLSVAVDVGNGAGALTARALDELGCAVVTLNGQPDGRFPARPSEPTAENCASLRTVVAETDADLGIAHDGDADRMRAVDETGSFVSGDDLLALFARDAVERTETTDANDGGDTELAVAVPVDTSRVVADTLSEYGASVTQTPVGDVFVAEAAVEPGVVFGGEPSGAWIWPDETLCPDGPLAACKLVELLARSGPLSELTAEFDSYVTRRENVAVEDLDTSDLVGDATASNPETNGERVGAASPKAALMTAVEARVEQEYDDESAAENVSTMDGVRIDTAAGWLLVRASGTEPVIRITAEAEGPSTCEALLASGRSLLARAVSDPTEFEWESVESPETESASPEPSGVTIE